MSDRIVVIDESVNQQINVGNAEVGMAARNVFLKDKATGYIHQDIARMRLAEADRELLKGDLGVRDSSLLRGFNDAVKRWENSGVSRLGGFPEGFRPTAALAIFLQEQGYKVEVMTLNRQFADAWREHKGVVVRDVAHIRPIQGKVDYNRARVLVLGAQGRNLNVAANGSVLPTKDKPAPPGPRTTDGARTVKGPAPKVEKGPLPKAYATPDGYVHGTVNDKPVKPATANESHLHTTKKKVGEPISPTNENRVHPSHAAKDARFQLVKAGMKAINRTVQKINDWIQSERLDEAWKKAEPPIRKELEAHPELGALLLAQYSKREKMGQEHDTDLEHTKSFQGLAVSYGYTREHAKDKYDKGKDQMHGAGPHQKPYYVEWLWIPPELEPDFGKLSTPFPSAGLAKFVAGREVLTRVKFSIASGFDDKMYSWESVSGASKARFIYMYVPNEVSYVDQGKRKTKSIEIAWAQPAIVPNQELKGRYFLPVVELDSLVNPYDALGVAVFPADTFTAKLFADTNRTDTGGLQVSDSRLFSYVRWVKPHRLEVLRHFAQDEFQ